MIKKQELLSILKKALEVEEKSIPIYMGHLNSAVFWVGIDKNKIGKAKELINTLATDSIKHKTMVEKMISEITGENKDAF